MLLQYVSYERPTLSKAYCKPEGRMLAGRCTSSVAQVSGLKKGQLQAPSCLPSMQLWVVEAKSKSLPGTKKKVTL